MISLSDRSFGLGRGAKPWPVESGVSYESGHSNTLHSHPSVHCGGGRRSHTELNLGDILSRDDVHRMGGSVVC